MTDGLHLESLHATATNVALPMGLTVDEVVLSAGRAEAQFKPFSLSLKKRAHVAVRVSAENVAKMLEEQSPDNLKNFTVTISDGLVIVENSAKVIVEIRVATSCTLRIEGGSKLFVDLGKVSVPGPMARNMIEQQLAKVNPILDLDDLLPSAHMDSVEAEDGYIKLKGTVSWP
jgi:hypothetical protein